MVRLGLVALLAVSLALATSTSGKRVVSSDNGDGGENSIEGFDNSNSDDRSNHARPHHGGKGKKKVKISSPGDNDVGGGGGDADVNRPPANLPVQPSPAPLDVKNATINPEDVEYLPGGPSTFTVTSSEVRKGRNSYGGKLIDLFFRDVAGRAGLAQVAVAREVSVG